MKKEIIGNATLYCGDCLELMLMLDKQSVDLIITDPPYGDNISYGRSAKSILNNESVRINYFALMYFGRLKNFIENTEIFDIKRLLTIKKSNFGMGADFRNQAEYCLVLDKGKGIYNLKNFSDVQEMPHVNHDENSHPHQKEINLLQKFIHHSSDENDNGQTVILDCFMGSGSTDVAALTTGKKFIGIELDPKWFDVACKRIEAECVTS